MNSFGQWTYLKDCKKNVSTKFKENRSKISTCRVQIYKYIKFFKNTKTCSTDQDQCPFMVPGLGLTMIIWMAQFSYGNLLIIHMTLCSLLLIKITSLMNLELQILERGFVYVGWTNSVQFRYSLLIKFVSNNSLSRIIHFS